MSIEKKIYNAKNIYEYLKIAIVIINLIKEILKNICTCYFLLY